MKTPLNDPAEFAYRFSLVVVTLAAVVGFVLAGLIVIAKQLKLEGYGTDHSRSTGTLAASRNDHTHS